MINKSILEVFGEKSKDGDEVKGLLNALMRNSYKKGGKVYSKKQRKHRDKYYTARDELYDLMHATSRERREQYPRAIASGEKEAFWDEDKYNLAEELDYVQGAIGRGEEKYTDPNQTYEELIARGGELEDLKFKAQQKFKRSREMMTGEKGKGIMSLLQRLLPGGETGRTVDPERIKEKEYLQEIPRGKGYGWAGD
tara:strand:+ start:67 stop:654 length:588 start_codon:yes stop_codon:yes gene_type:complete